MSKIPPQTDNPAAKGAASHSPGNAMLRSLIDVVVSSATITGSNAGLYCLAWLAASRLLTRGEIKGFGRPADLLHEECWVSAKKSGLPEEAFTVVWGETKDARSQEALNRRVLGVIEEFVEQIDGSDLADTLAELHVTPHLGFLGGVGGYDPGLCDLLIDLLDDRPNGTLWIPFDPAGQLVIRALRRNYQVIAAGPTRDVWSSVVVRLLALVDGRITNLSVEVERDPNSIGNSRLVNVDYLLACPPIGMKIPATGNGWRQWEGGELGLVGSESVYRRSAGQSVVQLDRSDSWAVAAFWPHVRRKAVFLTGPNLLFSKGQEQRLREFLVLGAKQPSAVVYLPAKLINHTAIVSAVTVLDRRCENTHVRMVDASKCTFETKTTMRFSRLLDSRLVLELIRGTSIDGETAKDIPLDQIAEQECNLMPNRYLRVLANDGEERVALGELVQTIVRAPVAAKEATALTVHEVGIADLGQWSPLSGPFSKTTAVQARKVDECSLMEGDILVSIKGTLGKVGLLGAINSGQKDEQQNAVCSQTCIALRAKRDRIEVLPLYLYLRSEDFRNQLEAFRVGVTVAHITPTDLLQDIKVPIKKLLDESTAKERFEELCRLEAEVQYANQRMDEIRRTL